MTEEIADTPQNKTDWWFYHVKGNAVDAAVVGLTKLCLGKDWHVLIVSLDATRRETLDRLLWTADPTSFIPHGRAEAEGLDPKEQPVLISEHVENLNNADVLLLLDSAEVGLDAHYYMRCITLFGDTDNAAKAQARARYKAAKDADLPLKYFQQDQNGRWVEQG